MKKLLLICMTLTAASYAGAPLTVNITNQLPVIEYTLEEQRLFEKVPDVAQYKQADWDNVVGIARGISKREAFKIAKNNPEITFFFYTNAPQMVLEKEDGTYRVFHRGDAVFFTGTPWWGSAPGMADGYVRIQQEDSDDDQDD